MHIKFSLSSVSDLVFYVGSMEERRYLKHDILTGDLDFSVIVTT